MSSANTQSCPSPNISERQEASGTVGPLTHQTPFRPLTNVLLAALDEPLTSVTVIEKLDVSQRSKERLANDLINFYSEHGKAYEFLCRVLARDIEECADPATLFRSNSLGTKALDFYMKVLGTKVRWRRILVFLC